MMVIVYGYLFVRNLTANNTVTTVQNKKKND